MNEKIQNKKRLLIVDDAATNRELLAHLFSDAYETEQAENGREALEKLSSNPNFTLVILDLIMPVLDGFGVLSEMMKDDRLKSIPVVVVTTEDETERQILALDSGAVDVITKPYNSQLVLHRVNNIIYHREMDKMSEQNAFYRQMLKISEIDEKTGIYNKAAFCRHAHEILMENPEKSFCILRWDIDHFKAFNDKYGSEAGDRIIRQTGQYYKDNAKKIPGLYVYGHWDADHFVTLREENSFDTRKFSNLATEMMHSLNYDFRCFVHAGIYNVIDRSVDVALMCDRALLALRSTKSNFAESCAVYDSSMRENMIKEQEITGEMCHALLDGQFVPYFQPQYNYDEKKLMGAEALVRWIHPEKGIIPPAKFIPLFEKNGFISEVDKYIWESVCQKIREWMDKGIEVVPISVNISRCDVYDEKLCDFLTELLTKYNIPASNFHTEITESAYAENTEKIYAAVDRLRKCGFQVHMDDFGSSYSSLNMLWTVPVDMIKLDLKFLGDGKENDRTGSILSSVVRMAHSIKIPVIAEGVETSEQADFLKSIGCIYMQGYYFSKPLPEKQFEELLMQGTGISEDDKRFDVDSHNVGDFLEYENQSVLLFNSFVGGAAIMEYDGKNAAILRMNDQFLEELGTTHREYSDWQLHVLDRFEDSYRKTFTDMLDSAIKTGRQKVCQTLSKPVGKSGDGIWLRCRARSIGKNVDCHILYITVDNISLHMNMLKRCLEQSGRTEKAERVLDEKISALASAARQLSVSIIEWNVDTGETTISDSYAKYSISAFKISELYGGNRELFSKFIYPDDLDAFSDFICMLHDKRRQNGSKVVRLKTTSGNYRWSKITFERLKSADKAGASRIIGTILDVDAEIKTEQSLEKSILRTKNIIANLPGGVMILEKSKDRLYPIYASEKACSILGISDTEARLCIANKHLPSTVPNPFDKKNGISEKLADGLPCEMPLVHVFRSDKTDVWVRTICSMKTSEDKLPLVYMTFEDSTQLVRSSEEELWRAEKSRFISEATGITTFDNNVDTDTLTLSNTSEENGFGDKVYSDYVSTLRESGTISDQSKDSMLYSKNEAIRTAGRNTVDFCADIFGNGFVWYRANYVSLARSNGSIFRVVGRIDDINDVKTEQTKLKAKIQLDEATGLRNKAAGSKLIERCLKSSSLEHFDVLLFIDLDNFKAVNDTYGHLEGDKVLKTVGKMLSETFRKDDVLVRFGGDEFLVFMRCVGSIDIAKKKADAILNSLAKIKYEKIGALSCSMGIAAATDTTDFYELINRADSVLYESKKSGKSKYTVYGEQQ